MAARSAGASGTDGQSGDKFAQIVETATGWCCTRRGRCIRERRDSGRSACRDDLESFVRQANAEALADVSIYDFDGNPLASTFPIDERTAPEEGSLDVSGVVLDDSVSGGTVRERRTLFGRDYELLYGRLEVRDQAVGLYSVGLSTGVISNKGETTRTTVMLLFGAGMAAVLGVGMYVTHRLTKPILGLVQTARIVAAGDLTVRSGVNTGDEIGILATSFDDMTAKLQRQHLSTIRALTSAIDARDPYTMGHSVRVGQLAMMLGKQLGMEETRLARLESAATCTTSARSASATRCC